MGGGPSKPFFFFQRGGFVLLLLVSRFMTNNKGPEVWSAPTGRAAPLALVIAEERESELEI
jgi:hypothetical protein